MCNRGSRAAESAQENKRVVSSTYLLTYLLIKRKQEAPRLAGYSPFPSRRENVESLVANVGSLIVPSQLSSGRRDCQLDMGGCHVKLTIAGDVP